MAERIAEIWIAFVFGGGLWLIGFYGQRTNNAYDSISDGLTVNGFCAYLFGVRPKKERLHLRIATLQALGLAYLAFVAVAVWFWDAETVRRVGLAGFVSGLAAVGLFWAITNLCNGRK